MRASEIANLTTYQLAEKTTNRNIDRLWVGAYRKDRPEHGMDFRPEDPMLALLLCDHLRAMSSDATIVPSVWRFLRRELQKETFYDYELQEPTDHRRLRYRQIPITSHSRIRECIDEHLEDVKTDYQHWVRTREINLYLSQKTMKHPECNSTLCTEHHEKYCR